MKQVEKIKIAVIGAGKMGEALIRGLLGADGISAKNLSATVKRAARCDDLSQKLGIRVDTNNAAAARDADLLILAVKPQIMSDVLQEMAGEINPSKILVSVAASVPSSYIESRVPKGTPVIRTMPNTPSLIGHGMTGIAPGKFATEDHMVLAERIFGVVGRCLVLDERHMDAVTGLSASGPAYIYMVIESLAEAGVKVGLPREYATQLAAQMTLGASQMVLTTGSHPALLKDTVTTPAGCTIDGILELEEGGLRVTLIKAVVKATERARELVKEQY